MSVQCSTSRIIVTFLMARLIYSVIKSKRKNMPNLRSCSSMVMLDGTRDRASQTHDPRKKEWYPIINSNSYGPSSRPRLGSKATKSCPSRSLYSPPFFSGSLNRALKSSLSPQSFLLAESSSFCPPPPFPSPQKPPLLQQSFLFS